MGFAVLCLAIFVVGSCGLTLSSGSRSCGVLNLLHIVPFPDNGTDAGWDKGLEVIPAGQVAVEHINQQKILKGLKLEMIDIPSKACNHPSPFNALAETLGSVSSSQLACVFGVVGLYCSTVVNSVAPTLSHDNFGYVHFSSATSPFLKNKERFRYLYRVLSSSDVYNTAVLEMMSIFGWKKASLVYDYDTKFYRNTAQSFNKMAIETLNFTLLDSIPFFRSSSAEEALFHITNRRSRINYLVMTIEDCRKVLCAASHHKLVWPRFVYIFPDRYLEEILEFKGYCSNKDIKIALEGVFFLLYKEAVTNDTTLVSGLSYQEYMEAYLIKRDQSGLDVLSRDSIIYANTLHDQVWAFALAFNESMGSVKTDINDTFEHIFDTLPATRKILAEKLQHISFQGATSWIQFGNEKEVPAIINIFQVLNGTFNLVAEYNSRNNNVQLSNTLDTSNLPSDSILVIHYTIPWSVASIALILLILIFVCLVLSTIAIVYWRNTAEVKSTSLKISLVLLFGCLMLCMVPVIHASNQLHNGPIKLHSFLCNAHYWTFFSGISVITSTLLFRLLRIFKIFHSYHSTGKYWSDYYLLLYIALACSGTVGIIVVWGSSDPLQSIQLIVHQEDSYDLVYNFCRSDKLAVWLGLLYVWIGLQLVVIIFLAIQTRHIKKKHFKDTKKINIFIAFIVVSYTIFFPLSYIFEELQLILLAYLARTTFFLLTLVVIQVLLFWPKFVPLIFPQWFKNQKDYTLTEAFRSILK